MAASEAPERRHGRAHHRVGHGVKRAVRELHRSEPFTAEDEAVGLVEDGIEWDAEPERADTQGAVEADLESVGAGPARGEPTCPTLP